MTLWVVSGGGVGGREHRRSRCVSKEKVRCSENHTETSEKVKAFNSLVYILWRGQEVADDIEKQRVWKNAGREDWEVWVSWRAAGDRKQQPTIKLGYLTPRTRAS